MNIFKKAMQWISRSLSTTDADGWKFLVGGRTYTGRAVDEQSAMQTSAVWACVRIIAESISTLPLYVYERQKNGDSRRIDHPVAELLSVSPNAMQTAIEYREMKTAALALQGNGYSIIERGARDRIVSLFPMASNAVEPRVNDAGNVEYIYTDRGKREVLPAEKVWHIRGFGTSALMGYSPIGYMRQAIGLSLAAEEFGARFFGQGATTSGIIEYPAWMTDYQRKKAREIITEKYEGLGNAHRVMVLEGGMKYSAVTMPLEDAQFLQTRKFQLAEICRVFRVPPHMIADLDRATFSNIEEMGVEFVTYTLLPWLRRWEASAERWLLPAAERGRIFIRHNFEGLMRANAEKRAVFYGSMLDHGVMTRNEVRALENLNRSDEPGMDDFTVQSAMMSIERVDEPAPPPPAPAPQPPGKAPAKVEADAEDGKQLVLNLTLPGITLPEIKMGGIQVPAPEVHVTVEKSGNVRTVIEKRDEHGRIISARSEELH